MPPEREELTSRDRELYLEGLRQGLTMAQAAKAAGRSPRLFKRLRDEDREFAAEFRVAYNEEGRDVLIGDLNEVIARLREVDPKSAMTGLFFLIKQRDPSFRENAAVALTGVDGGKPEVVVNVDFSATIEALRQASVVDERVAASLDAAVADGAESPALLPARSDGQADGGPGS